MKYGSNCMLLRKNPVYEVVGPLIDSSFWLTPIFWPRVKLEKRQSSFSLQYSGWKTPLSPMLKDKIEETNRTIQFGAFLVTKQQPLSVKEFLAWSSVSYSLFASEIRKIPFVQSGVEALSLRLFYTLKCICLCTQRLV